MDPFQTKEKHRVLNDFPRQSIKMDSTFLSWKHSNRDVYERMVHIKIYIWTQRREQMLNFIPHGSHKSELHLFINSLSKTVTMERRASSLIFHTILLLLSYRLLYKWFSITLNRLKCGNIDPQKKGAVLTAEELKSEYGKETNKMPLKRRNSKTFWPLRQIHWYAGWM